MLQVIEIDYFIDKSLKLFDCTIGRKDMVRKFKTVVFNKRRLIIFPTRNAEP